MKYMVASDIHGSAYWCEKIIDSFNIENPDRLLLLGDILYHGPRNDLPRDYSPKDVAAMLNGIKNKILCVRGNCDAEIDQMVLEFPILASYCIIESAGRLIFATHGDHYNTQSLPPMNPGDILLNGHFHVPAWEPFGDNNLYLNPGSASIPKNDSFNGYMVIDVNKVEWKTFDGNVYHSIDI